MDHVRVEVPHDLVQSPEMPGISTRLDRAANRNGPDLCTKTLRCVPRVACGMAHDTDVVARDLVAREEEHHGNGAA
jgi:hypothetical protein